MTRFCWTNKIPKIFYVVTGAMSCLLFGASFVMVPDSSPTGTMTSLPRRWINFLGIKKLIDVKEIGGLNLKCTDVLRKMVIGRWIPRSYTEREMDDLQYFLHAARSQHFLPSSLEREDKRCGNVTFDNETNKMHPLLWFRALCGAEGDTPCCYKGTCTARTKEQCRCDECYDMRQPIQTEFANWAPLNPTCKVATITNKEDVCSVLRNMTIYFIGDSFIRHVYISVLKLLRSGTEYGVLKKYTPPGIVHSCSDHFTYLGMCMNALDRSTRECGGNVKLRFMEYVSVAHKNAMLRDVVELSRIPNSLLFWGIGIHDNFNFTKIEREILTPVLQSVNSSKTGWPRILWASMHSPGLLKTPRIPSQSKGAILKYNANVSSILHKWGIPEFNTFNLTQGTMSFDGAHYGKGVNDAKAQILLNFIFEQNVETEWNSTRFMIQSNSQYRF